MTTPRPFLLALLPVLLGVLGCSKHADESALGGVGNDGPTTIAVPANLSELMGKSDVKRGAALYLSKGCKACHNLTDVKLVGPGLKGIGGRRSALWMARMILRPEVMIKEDPEAKKLFAAMMAPMVNQAVAADTELPALLAFLETL